jgi:hypothetical protein
MRRPLFLFVWLFVLSVPFGLAEVALAADNSALAGEWTYRSFHNNPALTNGDAAKLPAKPRRDANR